MRCPPLLLLYEGLTSYRLPYIKPLSKVGWTSSSFLSQKAPTSAHKMLTVGRLYITLAPRYAICISALVTSTYLKKGLP
jgi:hypothetical protein